MTLDDLECQNKGFYGFFGDFWLQHAFQGQILPKSLEIDQDSLHMKLSALNVVFASLNFAPVRLKNSPYGDLKLGYSLQNTHIRPLERQQPRDTVVLSGVCECTIANISLLGLVSLDFVRSKPLKMHRCRAFRFALSKPSC